MYHRMVVLGVAQMMGINTMDVSIGQTGV